MGIDWSGVVWADAPTTFSLLDAFLANPWIAALAVAIIAASLYLQLTPRRRSSRRRRRPRR